MGTEASEPKGNDLPDAINPKPQWPTTKQNLLEYMQHMRDLLALTPRQPTHLYLHKELVSGQTNAFLLSRESLDLLKPPPIENPFKQDTPFAMRYLSDYGPRVVSPRCRCLLTVGCCDTGEPSKRKTRTRKQIRHRDRRNLEGLRKRNPKLYTILYGDPVERREKWRRSPKGRAHIQRIRRLRKLRNR